VGVGGLPLNTRGKNNNGNPAKKKKKRTKTKKYQLKRQGKQPKKKLDNNSNSNSLAFWLYSLRPEVFGWQATPSFSIPFWEGYGCGTF